MFSAWNGAHSRGSESRAAIDTRDAIREHLCDT